MLTSLVAIVELICFLTFLNNWAWIAMLTIETRIFANSFLASLNGRITLRAMGDAPLTFVIPMMESTSNASVQMASVRQNTFDIEGHPRPGDKEATPRRFSYSAFKLN
ncbi:hypothetical protein DFH08DRAFT_285334 [Mycena albidolilacea]|uniref:Uncharacterized protein n=1 Tax=Mycena albidolilacea TaxID=1033008 RepID=A0AAD6ZRP5_9AGAR|nr:hypothetical protein DFH08DRAFT_285334 [Mycena albidolilacea]